MRGTPVASGVNMQTLRQRIRKHGIKCTPWKRYKYDVERLCVSGQCLFRRDGVPLDILEMELKSEGYLMGDESLLDCLADNDRLIMKYDDIAIDDPLQDYTEEDYRANGWL